MPAIDQIIRELSGIYMKRVDPRLFLGSEIYSTNEYLKGFSERWGYKISATGITLGRTEWDELRMTLDLPGFVGAQEFLPHDCISMKSGFAIACRNDSSPDIYKDHEMIHLAQYRHSDGFRRAIMKFRNEGSHSRRSEIRRIETEIVYEICAYISNMHELSLATISEALVGEYLVDSIRRFSANPAGLAPVVPYMMDGTYRIAKLASNMVKAGKDREAVRALFSMDFSEPFNEAMIILKR